MGQSRPLFLYFRSFLVTISMQIEKSVDCVLGIQTWGPQDGRRRRNHGAMAATSQMIYVTNVNMSLGSLCFLHSLNGFLSVRN